MPAVVKFWEGDRITVDENLQFPVRSRITLTAHVEGAVSVQEARAALKAFALPAGYTTVNGYDLSGCLEARDGGDMALAGSQDCTVRAYRGTVVWEADALSLAAL